MIKNEQRETSNTPTDRVKSAYAEMATSCGSEVEARLLAQIVVDLGVGGGFGLGTSEPRSDKEYGHVYVQAPIGPYKADILIECTFWDCFEPLNIVVECDGGWHDKYNQYHNDRKRDRYMQAQVYRVFRFPTAEI